jgi:tetratricopeptide (TPR) repeat protein
VSHVDIAPTILDAVGMVPVGSSPGSSLRGLIQAGNGGDRTIYFESLTYNLVRGWAPLRGVMVGREKYIDLPIEELYDLQADPAESDNRASKQPDRARAMANLLRTFDVAQPKPPGQESAEVTAMLRSLGYVSGRAPARKVYTEADDLKNLVTIDRDLHTASELFQNGEVKRAIDLLDTVIARRPDTADAYVSLAHAYWETGDVQQAIATLEKAMRSGAPDHEVRIRLGLYLAESGTDVARAIALLETLPADDVEALNARGLAYGAGERHQDAIRSFDRILELDPTNALAHQNIAWMELRQALTQDMRLTAPDRARKLQDAEQHIRRAIALDPTLAKAYSTLGVVLAKLGRKPEAIESWKRAVELDGAEFDALYNLVIVLSEVGRTDEARVYARQFVATAPPALYGPAIAELRRLAESGSTL